MGGMSLAGARSGWTEFAARVPRAELLPPMTDGIHCRRFPFSQKGTAP